MIHKCSFCLLLIFALILLTGCAAETQVKTVTPTPAPSPTFTSAPPTITPTIPPLAARVNGDYILLSDFQDELKRLQAAEVELGKNSTPDDEHKLVLDELVGQSLMAQAALKGGYQASDADLQKRVDALAQKAGSDQALKDWMSTNNYTEGSLRRSLRLSIAAAWQRDKILASLPDTADQVHARQILVFSEDLANKIFQQLTAGADYATLAKQYDPLTGGDLGWFPHGYLTQPDVEAAAFSLKPGDFSQVIHTSFGYHILQMIDHDPQRKLDPEPKLALQHKALQDWVEKQRQLSKIEILTQ